MTETPADYAGWNAEQAATVSLSAAAEEADSASQRGRERPPPPRRATTAAADPAAAVGVEQDAESASLGASQRRQRLWAFVASTLVHAVGLIALALVAGQIVSSGHGVALTLAVDAPDDFIAFDEPMLTTAATSHTNLTAERPRDMPTEGFDIGPPTLVDVDKPQPAVADIGFRAPQATNSMLPVESSPGGGGTQGRQGDTKQALLRDRGGNEKSEQAVARGLRWLAAHQRSDGSWCFDHTKEQCNSLCRHPGTEASTTAATGLALLAFLGAGYTHQDGEYKDTVQRGLYHLSMRAAVTPHGIDLQSGTMYGQAIATLALCEAYGMTHDVALRDLAKRSVDFILYAQDRKGGGWRYTPGEPGDTTVTGWQLMALKSAQMAGLEIPSPSIGLVSHFLDSVQVENGSQYGYLTPTPKQSTTAIGLLCRMYTGWRHEHPALAKGVAYLGKWGPADDQIYYNYYATQVLCHYDGPHWQKWNRRMRDSLIAAQATTGHESGSWFFSADSGAEKGGRLYCTALAVMTLEVYYRYMPLYGARSVEKDF